MPKAVINYKDAYNITNGKVDLFGELLSLFKKHSANQLDILQKAVTDQDSHSIEYAAHDLKSSLISLGAEKSASLCAELENMGKKNLIEKTDSLFNNLNIAITEVNDLITSGNWKTEFLNQENENVKK